MERMSDEQLEQRIQRFMQRKLDQFPSLVEQPSAPRNDSSSLLSRLSAARQRMTHLHGPRHASLT